MVDILFLKIKSVQHRLDTDPVQTNYGFRTGVRCYMRSPGPSVINIDYRQVSNIRRTLVVNKIVDHSDVIGASPVGAAPTTSSFST